LSMKVLVTGAGGQLGLELKELLPRRGHEAVALARKELDVTDARAVEQALEQHAPDLIINAAAYTNVDACETEPKHAYWANALGPRNLAQFCERSGCELLHVSTNYVFDGSGEHPYEPFHLPNPISAYGRTKLAGEEYVKHLSTRWYIVRSAGLYGEGHNFVRTMLRLGKERDSIRVKDDEFISPTYTRDLARGIADLVDDHLYGVYHLTNAGSCSWYELARQIFELSGLPVDVKPISSSEYPLPAARPANGVLSSLGGPELRHWKEALEDYLNREALPGATGG
jgi:dTDP-4-dehydrorhamnose reductase